jgi:hypothetical protein
MNRRISASSCQTLTAGFYLPKGKRPFLTIPVKEPHLFYFVDRVVPEAGWREGQVNMFSWVSEAVMGFGVAVEPLFVGGLGDFLHEIGIFKK